jgi:putative component of toxin-antitoxin plasmid stabilization module
MNYTRRGGQVVLMLGGGDKSTQRQDIAAAKARALRIL